MPPSIPGWSTLDAALAAWWAVEDRVPILLVGTLHISWLALSYRLLLPRELAAVLALIALEAAVVCLSALRPAAYLRHRLPLVAGIRALSGAFPLLVDVSRLAGRAAAGCADVPGGGAGACAAPEEAGDASSLLRALGLLLLPVAWLHSCLLAPISIHLPPLAHVVVHTATVVLLMRRATTACRQYAAQHPANARLAGGVHWVMRQAVSLLCPGTREHLAAAAGVAGAAQQCTAVVWALQASLGFVLPTLLCWRAQLRDVRRHEAQQEQRWLAAQRQRQVADADGLPGTPRSPRRRRQDWGPPPQVDCSFTSSQYRQMCEPILALGATVGWPVLVVGAGLAAWVAATVRSSHLHRP